MSTPGALVGVVIGTPEITVSPGNQKNTISLNASITDAEGYDLYWDTTTSLGKQSANVITGVSFPYDHTGLTNGTQYFYTPVAWNDTSQEESDAGTQQSGTPQDPAPPAASWMVGGLFVTA